MKTRLYLNRSRRRKSGWWGALVIIALSVVIVWAGPLVFRPFSGLVLRAASPFLRIENYVAGKVRGMSSSFHSKEALLEENLLLKQKVAEFEAALANYRILQSDNELLREELGLKKQLGNITIAQVLSHPWNISFDVVLAELPRGARAKSGDQVTFKNNVLAGEVVEVAGDVVKIKLISAPEMRTPVLIGEASVPAVAIGRGNGNLAVALPRSLELRAGDMVRAASTTQALVVGTVGSVDKNPAESLQTVLVRTPINLSFVRYLEINGY